ncbi:AbrB/MazE/SpoVT family DNA-binding domain-containing protein [Thiohalocapsa sp. ML1]|jgi:AbrB family looped-hinge helix DNA binding protein|uniref:AbrB/MazE/SpoVT family DNA-binding domain-containing protein n=1 Tax=Thiohalocapsa sp. ML1 TaxID=1431688 RepID=UPI0007321FC8|nr:AbrB/MazE/SpoVT family DNA-binding domain-containing protein [Thiohalocapsa sp. ML1]
MSVDKVVIGESGEIVLPSRIRSALRLQAGCELLIERTGAGVLLRPTTTGSGVRLEDLRGFLKTEGPAVPLEELCKPVDYSADWPDPESAPEPEPEPKDK